MVMLRAAAMAMAMARAAIRLRATATARAVIRVRAMATVTILHVRTASLAICAISAIPTILATAANRARALRGPAATARPAMGRVLAVLDLPMPCARNVKPIISGPIVSNALAKTAPATTVSKEVARANATRAGTVTLARNARLVSLVLRARFVSVVRAPVTMGSLGRAVAAAKTAGPSPIAVIVRATSGVAVAPRAIAAGGRAAMV